MASCLYIDGLGLYYGSVKGTPYLWLNLEGLAQSLGVEPPIARIRYFATKDPDPESQARQATYLRAVRMMKRVRTYEVDGAHAVAELSQHLLRDDAEGRFSVVLVLSIDGRLAPAIERISCPYGVVAPYFRRLSDPSLTAAAQFIKRISKSALETNQLPDTLIDESGEFAKPEGW